MTILTFLQFITNVCSYLAGSSLFTVVLLGIFCMFLLIALIRVVWYIVQFN